MMICFCGCIPENESNTVDKILTKEEKEVALPGTYDSKDTAILLSKNEKEQTLAFFNLKKKKNYTLSYDGTTKFSDKYDGALALSQVKEGTIVDVTFLKNSKMLNTLKTSEEAWNNQNIQQFSIDESRKNMVVGEEIYQFDDHLVVMQEDQQMELMDINAVDVLSISGIGNKIYSVQIEEGHGYLQLNGDEYFIGGWIEVGQSLICQITEGMLLTVPEGNYDVALSHKGISGTESVTIHRNEETTLDVSSMQGEEVREGTVLFTTNVKDLKVFLDGFEVDISEPVKLEYGIHQLMAKAEGYKTSTSYLKVAQESATIHIVLDEEDKEEETEKETEEETDKKDDKGEDKEENKKPTVSDNNTTVSGNDQTVSGNGTPSIPGYYQVHIDNPSGVEVYLDGNYVGISPMSFKKSAGTHVITLRKKGYETRSYTITLDHDQKDASYSFVDLEKE